MYAFMCIHDVCIVRLYVVIHVNMHLYDFMPILYCVFKQCIVCVPETSILIFKMYMFVFVLFMDKHV